MLDPNFDIDMFESFKVVVLEHLFCDSDFALDTLGPNELSASVVTRTRHLSTVDLDRFREHPGL